MHQKSLCKLPMMSKNEKWFLAIMIFSAAMYAGTEHGIVIVLSAANMIICGVLFWADTGKKGDE